MSKRQIVALLLALPLILPACAGGQLRQAARGGNLATVQALLHENLDTINEQDNNGQTALMIAAAQGHPQILQRLLEFGADVNTKDNNGQTAFMQKNKVILILCCYCLMPGR